MTASAARATTNYTLEKAAGPRPGRPRKSLRETGKRFLPLFAGEKANVIMAVAAISFSSITALVTPVLMIRAIDTYIRPKHSQGLLAAAAVIFAIYVSGAIASYIQVRTMGGV